MAEPQIEIALLLFTYEERETARNQHYVARPALSSTLEI